MIIKNESGTFPCRYRDRGCTLDCRGCQLKGYKVADYDGFSDIEVQ